MISLRSKVTQKILNFLFLNDRERFYVNQLAKLIEEDPSNVYKKLLQLRDEGIISDEFQGKERYFFLNKKYPLLKEYKNIVLKTIGLERILKNKLKELKGVKFAYLFGSYAHNKLSLQSDIDLLVIGSFDTLALQRVLLGIQRLSGREINSIEMTEKEFQKKRKGKDVFLEDILSRKYIEIL